MCSGGLLMQVWVVARVGCHVGFGLMVMVSVGVLGVRLKRSSRLLLLVTRGTGMLLTSEPLSYSQPSTAIHSLTFPWNQPIKHGRYICSHVNPGYFFLFTVIKAGWLTNDM